MVADLLPNRSGGSVDSGDVGRLGEFLAEAAAYGLELTLFPPGCRTCGCPECVNHEAAWRIQAHGPDWNEDLSLGQTLADAIEYSTLPFRLYTKIWLEGGVLAMSGSQDTPANLELGPLGDLVKDAAEEGVALSLDPPCDVRVYGRRWCVRLVTRDAFGSLGLGETLAEAVEEASLRFPDLRWGIVRSTHKAVFESSDESARRQQE
jgi:hypothetical protein